MKEIILCFREEVYAERLRTFIRKYYQQEFRITGVADKACVEKQEGELLLTDDWELYQRFLQSESCYFDFDNRGTGINPYQSVDVILSSLLWQQQEESCVKRKEDISLVVFYTPGGSSSQRKAALQKSKEHGRGGKCLYLPVRDMEILREEDVIPYDLSELCYCLKRTGKVQKEQILAAIRKGEEHDSLRGFHFPLHLGELGREISGLIEEIEEKTDYDKLVLDLQILLPDYKRIFQQAEEVYAVEDASATATATESFLYIGIEQLKKEPELKEMTYKIWKWGEIVGTDQEIE